MTKTVLTISGMYCGMCEAHVNDVIRNHFTVNKVTSSHKKGTTEIISETMLDETELKNAISGIGYSLENISVAPYEKKKFSLFG